MVIHTNLLNYMRCWKWSQFSGRYISTRSSMFLNVFARISRGIVTIYQHLNNVGCFPSNLPQCEAFCDRLWAYPEERNLKVSDPAAMVAKTPFKLPCCRRTQFLPCSLTAVQCLPYWSDLGESRSIRSSVYRGAYCTLFSSDRFDLSRVITEYLAPFSKESSCIIWK